MTPNYRRLLANEKQIQKCFVTKTVLSNSTTPSSQNKLRSYRLLLHAEIEFYLESLILQTIDRARNEWIKSNKVPKCIASVLAFSKATFPNPPSHLADLSTDNDFPYRVHYVLAIFEKNVKRNNGIKEENIIPLIVPLGIDYSKINQTLLNNMSSFGQNRGFTAHNSIKVHQLINPIDEISKVKQILDDLLDIDKLLSK